MKTAVLPRNFIYFGELILVNPDHSYREQGVERSLVPVDEGDGKVLMARRSAVLLSKLMDELEGWAQIAAVSGWRSEREQREIFDQSLLENGADFTDQFVAKPGHSEHQTGFAIDLGLRQPDIDFIRPDFPYSGICQTFREKAALYGFIERYPAGKETVTGIAHEPWHFRYVGTPHAAVMTELGLTLEEYVDFLKRFAYGDKYYIYQKGDLSISISYLEASAGADTHLEIDPDVPYSVSGNNEDGFIVTQWRRRDDTARQ
jgi:D-alanyl-D-alanine dipeptidase/carboxypeptidase